MPAFDSCHPQIIRALEKAGWRVVAQQERFWVNKRIMFIDIKAARGINGRSQQILLSEVKCFPDSENTTREVYVAIGQYIVYQAALDQLRDTTPLYLTIPEHIYNRVFDEVIRRAVNDHRIKLIVVNLADEVITQWNE